MRSAYCALRLEDGDTVHNAFFDRNFREDEPLSFAIIRKPTASISS